MKNIFLLIGPRKNITNPERTGGVIVLFEDLISYCNTHAIEYLIVDTNKENYKNKLAAYMIILFSIIVKTPKVAHVSLHGTANDFLLVAPFALIVSKIFRKSFSLRKFAGNFIELFENYAAIKKKIIIYILKQASYNFFETKYLVNYFKQYNQNTYWFPNVRAKQYVFTDNIYRKKLLFIGAVSEEKGIEVLCHTSNLLSDGYEIDIYGGLCDHYTQAYFSSYKVKYKGTLKPENVINTLKQYDILLLPSFREGYPGVIVEALSVGLPIIATNLKGIKEMVDEQSSVLIDPDSVEQLREAIESVHDMNYAQKSAAAKKQFEQFDSELQTKLFFKRIGL
ncbi:MAG: hypothetical protein DSZ03_06895 [Sulfurimonas sp.]|nr:MAG: hypothetical protein DSZ03_06895 [Sulfurimonas sp.]